MPEAVSGGGGLFDMDGDGDLDAYLVQGGDVLDGSDRPPNRLYENLGDGRFRDVTDGSGAADRGYGMGLACADYDDDGDVDLYVTNYGANRLLRNDGSGRFEDVTETAGVGDESWGASALFFDYDADGRLDLYVSNYVAWSPEKDSYTCENKLGSEDYCGPMTYDAPARDVLYRNEGDGRFREVTVEAGLNSRFGNGLGVVAGDYNDDGRLDLFVANDMNLDQLWINKGGRFVDEALLAGCAVDMEGGQPKAGMGVTAGDIDGDGDLDLMVCNLVESSDSVFRNDGSFFTDVTAAVGLGSVSRGFTRFGMGWADFDNDGRLDLYQGNGRILRTLPAYVEADLFAEPNLLFRAKPDGTFEEVAPRGGTDELLAGATRGVVFGDVDNDGGQDLIVINRDAETHLLINRAARGNWVGLDVQERAGGPAEGAVVRLRVGDRTLRRDVRSGYSYLTCNDPRVHFGLESADAVDSVEVTWVDGDREEFAGVSTGAYHQLRRGQGRALPPRAR